VTVLPSATEAALKAGLRATAVLVAAKASTKALSLPPVLFAASAAIVNPKNVFSHTSFSL
jgi:hypothetical protein